MTVRPEGTIPSEPDKWCPYCASSEAAITDPDERIAALKEENKKLRDRVAELSREYDRGRDHEGAYWQTTHGVYNANFFGCWGHASHIPWGVHSGEVRLMLNYGGGSQYKTWQYLHSEAEADEYAARLNALSNEEAPGFHWRRGFFFNVAPDGCVEIIRRPTPQHFPVLHARIPPNEWASIVGFVSPAPQPEPGHDR